MTEAYQKSAEEERQPAASVPRANRICVFHRHKRCETECASASPKDLCVEEIKQHAMTLLKVKQTSATVILLNGCKNPEEEPRQTINIEFIQEI
jgi:hypothetical protein